MITESQGLQIDRGLIPVSALVMALTGIIAGTAWSIHQEDRITRNDGRIEMLIKDMDDMDNKGTRALAIVQQHVEYIESSIREDRRRMETTDALLRNIPLIDQRIQILNERTLDISVKLDELRKKLENQPTP